MQEINSVAFLRLLQPSTRGVGVYVGIAFAKLFGMRGSATIFGNFTNIASAKTPFSYEGLRQAALQEDLRQNHDN